MRLLIILALLAFAPMPAQAQTQTDVLQASLRPGWQQPDGQYMAALNLVLALKWKTYWRAPGETGIPPQFDWSASVNLRAVRLLWPNPAVFTLNGMQSIGYHDQLVLPIEVTPIDPAKPVELRVQLQLGICKDICMPAQVSLSETLSGTLGGTPDAAIRAALAQQPLSAAEAGLNSITCQITPIEDGLRLTAHLGLPVQGSPETVVFETADRSIWVAEAQANRDGAVLIAASDLVPQNGAPFALDRSGVTVTVIGQDRSVEITGCPAP